ncbi:hypothetical protein BDU57DRAFT_451817 [Ampelomyces quisqualis]|uniref:Aminoglycoside phosphotransferase domain-containing protein n=1 Tax=Ampelomyces quisqualis TaxID=50730 RepID=A0A6A5QLE3_AMPQU|nr:hypothetical protein BDU57DRAFT_451817 [Ampelomyces quisqualis]
MKLPYEAPSHPGIPTISEIDEAMKTNKLSGRYGRFPEAENLLFLEKHPQIRTPKLYAVFTTQNEHLNRPYYMVTEFIEGETLTYELWSTLDKDTRSLLCSNLAEQLQHIRSIPSEGYYGRLYKQGWGGRMGLLRTDGKKLQGPYDTYDEFFSAMFTAAELQLSMNDNLVGWHPRAESYLSKFKHVLSTCTGRQPTLTHLDPGLYNIIVNKVQGEKGNTDHWEIILIDWAEFGWYPAWMQSVAFDSQICFWSNEEQKRIFASTEEALGMLSRGFDNAYPEQVEVFRLIDREGYSVM